LLHICHKLLGFLFYVCHITYYNAPHVWSHTYLPSCPAVVQGSPTMMCHHHNLVGCVAGQEVMAPPILFYLTQHRPY
jgi:hypothetical protein